MMRGRNITALFVFLFFSLFITLNIVIGDDPCDDSDIEVKNFAASLPRHITSDIRQEKFAVKETAGQFTISYLAKGVEIFKKDYPDTPEPGVSIGEITPVVFRGQSVLFISHLYGAGGAIKCFHIIRHSQKLGNFSSLRLEEKDLPDVVGTKVGEMARKARGLEKEIEQERSRKNR